MSFWRFIKQAATPSAPASTKSTIFVDTSQRVRMLDSSGADHRLNLYHADNVVRNSGFWFAQRQAVAAATTYSSTAGRAISADGWGISNENASATYRRIDTLSAPETSFAGQYWGEFVKITSTGKLSVTQVIEGRDIGRLRGRTVRLSCKMKQIVGAAPVMRLGLLQLTSAGTVDTIPATFISAHGANGVDPTLGTNVSRITPKSGITGDNCTVSGDAANCTLSSDWQRFSVVFDVPSSCKNLIVCIWGNNQFVATNGFGLAEVMLTEGQEIHEFSSLALPVELSRVRRYYNKTFALETAPATNAGVATGCLRSTLVKAAATALAAQFQWIYPTPMRAAATTVTLYNPGAANAQVRQIGGVAADLTASASANSTEQSVDVTATGAAGGTVGDQVGIHLSADAEL